MSTIARWALAALLAGALAGCTSGGGGSDGSNDGGYGGRGPIYPIPSGGGGGGGQADAPAPSDDDYEPGKGWRELGSQSVGRNSEYDRFTIQGDRQYRQVKFAVSGARIDLESMNIVFKEGPDFAPRLEQIFEPGQASPVIDFPGEQRRIDYVEFRYRRLGNQEATLTLYGKP